MADARSGRRSSFGPVVLLGLASAGLAALAGHHTWVSVSSTDPQAQALADNAVGSGASISGSPAAGALALVLLAAWGVLLVTRGRVRRVVAVLALLAAAGFAVAVVLGASEVPDLVRSTIGSVGAPVEVGRGLWFWLAVVAVPLTLASTALAVRLVPGWPEMGTRYDAPVPAHDNDPADPAESAGASGAHAAANPVSVPSREEDEDDGAGNLELWKAIEEGRDPTA